MLRQNSIFSSCRSYRLRRREGSATIVSTDPSIYLRKADYAKAQAFGAFELRGSACSETPEDVIRLETFGALGIQFVSLSEQVDTSTPAGKMFFTVLGAVAELERNLIVERVRAGLRHARAKGKRLGRPRKSVDVSKVRSLRAAGESWRTIARKTGASVGTVFAAAQERQDIICANPAAAD